VPNRALSTLQMRPF